jgi:hypothetical protein
MNQQDRRKAVEEIGEMHGRFATPTDLNRIVEDERDEQADEIIRQSAP